MTLWAEIPLTPRVVIRALEHGGWVQSRQVGSHLRLYNPERPANSVTVSMHQGHDIPVGTVHAILRSAGLSRAMFEELLR